LQKLDENMQLRIIKAINQLPLGDVKKLQGNTEDYRLRVGNYRIIFSKDDENLIILIIEIAPRGEVYNRI
jgi:mRNA interferase RelE/StbE